MPLRNTALILSFPFIQGLFRVHAILKFEQNIFFFSGASTDQGDE